MTGETKGWTPATALEHMTVVIETNQRHMTELLQANQQRTDDGFKALRELIDERDKRWPTRDEIRKEFTALEKDIANLRESRSAASGETTSQKGSKVDRREDWRLVVAGLALAVAVLAILLGL